MNKAMEQNEQESMEILHGLASEIKDMDEIQRLQTLEWVVREEARGKGDQFWLLIVKELLLCPELIVRALKLSAGKLENPIKHVVKLEDIVKGNGFALRKRLLTSCFYVFPNIH